MVRLSQKKKKQKKKQEKPAGHLTWWFTIAEG
jgi:hypothetical protein